MTLEMVYARLGLLGKDCLVRRSEEWREKVQFPDRIIRLLGAESTLLGRFDAVLVFDGKPLILFYGELSHYEKKRLCKDIWNFNETPVVIIVSRDVVEVFNGFDFIGKDSLLKKICTVYDVGKPSQLDDFSYFKLVSGEAWKDYLSKKSIDSRVDRHLLRNISVAREKLIKHCDVNNKTANALLGKIIFIRYLIDRKVRVNFPSAQTPLDTKSLCRILKSQRQTWNLFCFLQSSDKGFNGDLFPMTEQQIMALDDKALRVLVNFVEGDDIASGQQSIFDPYDFSILPIEFISCVYESFIGEANQAKSGAYYTPLFLVDYMVKETVGVLLEGNSGKNSCKVLDPSCGSGIFLVESLRRMIEKYMTSASCPKRNTKAFRDALCKLVKDNIFGIDKDESAVHVAIFSIYLTLLDYQSPPDIEKFKFPNLFGTNLIYADTFDENNLQVIKLFKEAKENPFDVIIGNPPWRRSKAEMGENCVRYISKVSGGKHRWFFSGGEIAQAFLVRSLDFSSNGTLCALIATSKVLYNLKAIRFREAFLDNVRLYRVFELSSVRKELFNRIGSKAIAPACILFFSPASAGEATEQLVEHVALKPSRFFSLFRSFMLTTRDIQYVKQSLLKANDFLWKVLVYGSWLDFVFIKRLMSPAFTTVGQEIDRRNLKRGQGVTIGRAKMKDASDLLSFPFVDTERKDILPYFVKPTNTWTATSVTRKRDVQLFRAPVLLVKLGLDTHFRASSAILYEDAVYTHAIASVKGSWPDLPFLRSLVGLYNSDFFTYFGIMCFGSLGIDRTRVVDNELRDLPYCGEEIATTVAEIENSIATENSEIFRSDIFANQKQRTVNEHIFSALECTDSERALINYANTVIVPYCLASNATDVDHSVSEHDRCLDEYAAVFIDRFGELMSGWGKKFIADIRYSRQVLGVVFTVVRETDSGGAIRHSKQESNESLLKFIVSLAADAITERLFVQKDVRGFSRDGFFVFKPNEKRLWHKAVAYVDAEEFADAIIRAGRDLK